MLLRSSNNPSGIEVENTFLLEFYMNPKGVAVTCQDVCVSGSDGLNLHNARLCSLVGTEKKKKKILRCNEQIMYQKVHG